jgi:hypothetical protein
MTKKNKNKTIIWVKVPIEITPFIGFDSNINFSINKKIEKMIRDNFGNISWFSSESGTVKFLITKSKVISK